MSNATVTQLAEYLICNQDVVGSFPTRGSAPVAQTVEHHLGKVEVSGSIPDGGSDVPHCRPYPWQTE